MERIEKLWKLICSSDIDEGCDVSPLRVSVPWCENESAAVIFIRNCMDRDTLYREKGRPSEQKYRSLAGTLLAAYFTAAAYFTVEHWIFPRLEDSSVKRDIVAGSTNMTTQLPCHTCSKLGHWMADFPLNKSSKPSGSDKQNDTMQNNQQKHKKKKKSRVKFANLIVEETLGRNFGECKSLMLTRIILTEMSIYASLPSHIRTSNRVHHQAVVLRYFSHSVGFLHKPCAHN